MELARQGAWENKRGDKDLTRCKTPVLSHFVHSYVLMCLMQIQWSIFKQKSSEARSHLEEPEREKQLFPDQNSVISIDKECRAGKLANTKCVRKEQMRKGSPKTDYRNDPSVATVLT